MKNLQLKNVTFNQEEIVFVKKSGNIIIRFEDIERIEYVRPRFFNYLLSVTWFGGTYPSRLQIYLNKKVKKTKLYLVKIKYKEFLNLKKI